MIAILEMNATIAWLKVGTAEYYIPVEKRSWEYLMGEANQIVMEKHQLFVQEWVEQLEWMEWMGIRKFTTWCRGTPSLFD